MKEEIFSQGFNETSLAVVTGVQYATYGFVLGILGIILAKNIRLWKDKFTLEQKPFIYAAIVGIIGGVSMIAFDLIWFGKEVPLIADSYLVKPSVATILGSMILGGIVEEVMLRLFMMSLIAFVLLKIFRKTEKADVIFIVANIISALLFAASHLPSTQIMIGLTPITIFRCFLLNGGLGLGGTFIDRTEKMDVVDGSIKKDKYAIYDEDFNDYIVEARWWDYDSTMEKPGCYSVDTETLAFSIEVNEDAEDEIYYAYYYSKDKEFDKDDLSKPLVSDNISPVEYGDGRAFYDVNCDKKIQKGYYVVVVAADEKSINKPYIVAYAEVK
jgi:membrane protease YdiL (CAAX protease family)